MDFRKTMETNFIRGIDVANALTQTREWAFADSNGHSRIFLARVKNGQYQVAAILDAGVHYYQANQNIEWEPLILKLFPRVTPDNILYIYVGSSRTRQLTGRNVIRINANSGSIWGFPDKKFMDARKVLKGALYCERKTDAVTSYRLYGHTYNPIVNYSLIATIAIAMLIGFKLLTDPYTWGVGTGYTDAYRFISYLFIHANVAHLAGNLLAFVAIAASYAELQGGLAVSVGFFGGGILAGLFTVSYNEFMGTSVLTVGASGAIFALLGAVIMVKLIGHTASKSLIYLALVALVVGSASSGIDMACHIGGFLGGLLIGWTWYEVSEDYYINKALKTKDKLKSATYIKGYSPQYVLQSINARHNSQF